MDQDHNGSITIDEFTKVFMEAEDILKQKVDRADSYLADFQKQKQEAVMKLEDLKRTEEMNQYGIMKGSILTLTVEGVHDLPLNAVQEVYVKATCDDASFETDVVRYDHKATWSEAFSA